MRALQKDQFTEERQAFYQAVIRGIECFEEAGRRLVELFDKDPNQRQLMLEENPIITEDVIAVFERIGRKQLFYRLCLNEGPGVRALRNCPYSEQVKYADEPIDLLLLAGGKTETLKVSVWAMTTTQAKQVFNGRRLRSLAGQRAWLEGQKPKAQNVAIGRPYTLRRTARRHVQNPLGVPTQPQHHRQRTNLRQKLRRPLPQNLRRNQTPDQWRHHHRKLTPIMNDYKHAEIVGPFTEPEFCYASVDGYLVPHIKLVRKTGADDGKIEIHLDGRMVYIIDDTAIDVVLSLLANAMAVAAGYTAHGANCRPKNPFTVKLAQLNQ